MAITVRDLRALKQRGERFVMLTAYDYPTARILDEAGIPVILVGDSVGNNVLGYETTIPVTMQEMLHHTRAVVRGATNALVVGDMPFMSFHTAIEDAIANAGRFLKEGGAHAIKLERPVIEVAAAIVDRGIPVMGHIGLGPQSVHAMGGYRVQGRTEEDARKILDEAQDTDPAQFSVLLEVTRPPEATGRWLETKTDPPRPGRFSMVGDFQQSIYHDRADLAHYQRVHDALVTADRAIRDSPLIETIW